MMLGVLQCVDNSVQGLSGQKCLTAELVRLAYYYNASIRSYTNYDVFSCMYIPLSIVSIISFSISDLSVGPYCGIIIFRGGSIFVVFVDSINHEFTSPTNNDV